MTPAIQSVPRRFPVPPRFGSARRLGVLVIALAVAMLVSPGARAAARTSAVPMCSSDGRSVVAPPIIMPFRLVTLDAPPPCPRTDEAPVQSAVEHQQRSPSNPPAPELPRAVPVRPTALARPAAERLWIVRAAAPTSRVLVGDLYRPPRG